ncbi:hypothetical protein GCM10010218_61350 [Streptomyces mashuensis]|uniref:Uncharacterized protein n=1 Tax=Streptomyces mashuensis TaxID=33904 RepID=A0A919B8I8_9ACTN|nr:hypothetical protein [Streptomyces mashuensis]GHF71843.1 hypothetical protein GCM10010218_61350 [Streptomyces mashuensis]
MTGDRDTGGAGDPFAALRAVADAVLYEGYLLYPYRRSSPKNRVRWQFGVLTPRPWAEADGPVRHAGVSGAVDTWYQQTECLVRAAPTAVVRLRVRHLQLQRKQAEERDAEGRYRPVVSLEADGAVHLTFDEAVPHETDLELPLAGLLREEVRRPVGVPAGEDTEVLAGGRGRVVRTRYRADAVTAVRAEQLPAHPGLYRLRVRTENTGTVPGPGAPRTEALRHALIATHTFLGGDGLEFLSLTDPPAEAEALARDCRNVHTFPVLAGAPGTRTAVLSAPVILPDHPRVAPESPGDLHDAAEIDEILTLRTLLLTDEEKREARATDARAAGILDRVEALPPEVLGRLHGAIRSLRPARPSEPYQPSRGSGPAWWEEGGDDGLCPATDTVLVDGVTVGRGSRVLLCPSGRGADAQDMFLAGRSARVAAVLHDVDGSVHVAVTVDDDPAAALHGWYGRFHHFRPHELRPLGPGPRPDQERCDGRPRVAEA